MIIECPRCDSHVDAKSCGVLQVNDGRDPWQVSLVECPQCHLPLLASQELIQVDNKNWDWTSPDVLWPSSERELHPELAEAVRESLDEARRCFKAKAFSACAVMIGRALEALCIEHSGERTLHQGLRALKDKGIIDGRLFEWGESLREERNLGAHASGHRTSAQDASDMLDFAVAICDYVYVLSKKYSQYQARKVQRKRRRRPNEHGESIEGEQR